ncbi:hypothetical protein, variant 1 [Aphanomyces astaci]|uniref:Uncharacterized protein n=1 Tax=Aphanomyces astaci TaxID=112090 RepID=W4GMD0_APHAT|nr:hypothetical protein, variant 1 [Aphanomyces astaci]ETV80832.1 hypothetical protein, variant 1 [Aphanomyces astaci]|eukprot:XP_009829779.1 hypothetical protein, variant 1 [Aphanomyces astaci]
MPCCLTHLYVAARDLERGGTWLGLRRSQGGGGVVRVAFLTNIRVAVQPVDKESRGNVVTDFLQSDLNVSDFVKQLQPTGCNYAGFNLVMFDGESLGYYCNLNPMGPTPDFTLLERDVLYGISNSVLGTPWIKVERGKAALADVLAMHKDQDDLALCRKLILPMVDTTRIEAPELLPQTGCPEAMEYQLSSIFVEPVGNPKYPKYGTRTTIAMVVDGGHATILEKDLDPTTLQWNEHTHSF